MFWEGLSASGRAGCPFTVIGLARLRVRRLGWPPGSYSETYFAGNEPSQVISVPKCISEDTFRQQDQDMDSNIETWLPSQARYLTAQWEQSLKRFFPQFAPDWEDPDRHMRAHQEQWNYMDAAKILKWESLLHGTGLEVLDLGAGTGWLAALLSQYPSVGAVETLDSSDFNMRVMVPAIFARMGGDAAKLKRIVGFFTPIQREDQCYDLVVASSAAHHAPDLVSLFRECHRVLKPGGKLVLLNEVPIPRRRYIWLGTGIFLKAMYSVCAAATRSTQR